jgi:hypothetical protein
LCLCVYLPVLQFAGYRLYGLHDVWVGGAAAQVAGQIVADLVRCGVWVAVEQFLGHENESGRAKAALECAVVNKGLLDRVELVAGGESLDSNHFGSIDKRRQVETPTNCDTIHECRAAATESLPATLACSKKIEIALQDLD